MTNIQKNKPIIVFDLHRVIFFRCWKSISKHIFYMPHKMAALKLLLSPRFWLAINRIKKKTVVSDDIYEQLVHDFPLLEQLKHNFFALENMQKAETDIVNFITVLKQRGYSLYILSNIGPQAFENLRQKHPFIIGLFDGFYIPQKSDGYIQKPAFAFFKSFIGYVDSQNYDSANIIFIDDNHKNIQAAKKCGMHGIVFSSCEKLKRDLKKLICID